MNYLDIIIVVSLFYGLIKGFSNGLVKEITGLLGFIIAVYVAVNFSSYLHPRVAEFLGREEQFVPIIAFSALFIFGVLAIRLLGYFLDKLTKALALGVVSKVLGSVFGVLKIIVIFSFLLVVITEYKLLNNQTQKESVLFEPLQEIALIITPEINKHKKNILEKFEKNTKKVKKQINKKVNP